MRVVECNICGEAISAASDEELVGRVVDHLGSEHDEDPDREEIESMVSEEAYEATDS
jgi:predicted small metal-binding protein